MIDSEGGLTSLCFQATCEGKEQQGVLGVWPFCTQARWAGWGEDLTTIRWGGVWGGEEREKKGVFLPFRNNLVLITPTALEDHSFSLTDAFVWSIPAMAPDSYL